MADERFKELISSYLDGELTPQEQEELEQLLAEDPSRAQLMQQETGLAGLLAARSAQVDLKSRVMQSIHAEQKQHTKDNVLKAIYSRKQQNARQSHFRRFVLTAAACLIIAIGLIVYMQGTGNTQTEIIAYIDQAYPGTTVLRKGISIEAEADMAVYNGDILNAENGTARIMYDLEETNIELLDGGSLRLVDTEGQKQLQLMAGRMECQAAPQPTGKPLLITTETAAVSVVGTFFALQTDADKTTLNVYEGAVAIKGLNQTESIMIKAGEYALAQKDKPVLAGTIQHSSGQAAGIRLGTVLNPDIRTVEEIIPLIIEDGMSDEAKAISLWRWMLQHTFHETSPREGYASRSASELRDGNKFLHVYGYGGGGDHSTLLNALARAAGFKARTRYLGHHIVSEIYYDDSWHCFDATFAGFARNNNGQIASVNELEGREGGDPSLLQNPTGAEPHFAWTGEGKPGTKSYQHFNEWFGENPISHGPQISEQFSSMHAIEYSLKPGESFIRYFNPAEAFADQPFQAGREGRTYFLGFLEPESESRELPYGRAYAANGVFEWQPDLMNTEAVPGHIRMQGMRSRAGRLETIEQQGTIIFTLQTPYVIAGIPGDADAHSGAIINGHILGSAQMDLSIDGGITWTSLGKRTGRLSEDITERVKGLYAYQIRFSCDTYNGLYDIAFINRVQINPAMLPWIQDGENEIRFQRIGQSMLHLTPDLWTSQDAYLAGRYADDNLKWQDDERKHLIPIRKNKPASVVFAVSAPRQLNAIQVSALCGAGIPGRNNESFSIDVSIDNGDSWIAAGKLDMKPELYTAWHTVEGKADISSAQTKDCLVRITINPDGDNNAALCTVNIYAAYEQPEAADAKITFAWNDTNGPQTDSRLIPADSDHEVYTITCGPETKPNWVKIENAGKQP